ncbi:lymphocyte antigen 6C2-like [Physella acuta]|uniref:lymphocyte antigen 6C2-like n=1 Tax=Physella acuta TaxID=109671 RepID=UPI0027DD5A1E|nr:lymphocyte antigen 6C2-like [Physella acuta]
MCRAQYATPCVGLMLAAVLTLVARCHGLLCYECSETFDKTWEPRTCQINSSAVPSRICNQEQPFCYVKRVTVKGYVQSIDRNCIDQCPYGCQLTEMGITFLTCTSCCAEDLCNIGNGGGNFRLCASALVVCLFLSFLTQGL